MLRSGGAWINAEEWSHPVYQATVDDPLTTVYTQSGPVKYRIPIGAQPALPPWSTGFTDAHMHVIDPTGRWVDECWGMHANGDGTWTCLYHVLTDLTGPGVGQGGTRAYGGSALGGLIRASDVDAGTIDHALALALVAWQMAPGPFWPATAQDTGAAGSPVSSTWEPGSPSPRRSTWPASVCQMLG